MTIYIVNFNDNDCFAAYASLEDAKKCLWDAYCEEYPEDVRAKCKEEDERTLANGYIIDYGWIAETELHSKVMT